MEGNYGRKLWKLRKEIISTLSCPFSLKLYLKEKQIKKKNPIHQATLF